LAAQGKAQFKFDRTVSGTDIKDAIDSRECFDFQAKSIRCVVIDSRATAGSDRPGVAGDKPVENKSLDPIVHKKGNDYLVVTTAKKTGTLKGRTILISMIEEGGMDFAGAFTVNGLTSPQFGLESRTVDGKNLMFPILDNGAQDQAKLGLRAFIHLFHDRFPLRRHFWNWCERRQQCNRLL
jgi:hypothetical protein